jgi:hypothetical protein
VVVVIALATAAMHREVPLATSTVPLDVLRVVEAAAPASGVAAAWSRLHLTSDRTFTRASGDVVRSRVRTSWHRVSPALLRRSDDWFEVHGSKALYQERSISGLGLVNLRWVERQPAPIYHDIFEDDGWFGETTTTLQLSSDPGFPLTPGSRLITTAQRRADKVPGRRSDVVGLFERTISCAVADEQAAAAIHESIDGRVVNVDCTSATRESKDGTPQITARTRYAYAVALAAFLPVERQEREPKSPFEADDAPPRWAITTIRYADVRLEP